MCLGEFVGPGTSGGQNPKLGIVPGEREPHKVLPGICPFQLHPDTQSIGSCQENQALLSRLMSFSASRNETRLLGSVDTTKIHTARTQGQSV